MAKSSMFEMELEQLITPEKQVFETEIYKPSLNKENKKTYESIIKFIPWYKDWTRSKRTKWSIWMVDPNTDEKRMVDCPSTIGEKSVLRDLYFALKNSTNADEQDLAVQFSRKERNFALIQIVEDKQHPELEGQIKVFEYGKTIREKIDAQLQPKGSRISPHNPFDLFEGKLFNLFIKMEGGFQNYDNATFLDERSSIIIDGKPIAKKKENQEKILSFLETNSPDLDKYDYQAWDDNTRDFVVNTITNIVTPGKLLNQVLQKSGFRPIENLTVKQAPRPTIKSSKALETKISLKEPVIEEDDEEADPFVEEDDDLSEIGEFLNNINTKRNNSKVKVDDFFDED